MLVACSCLPEVTIIDSIALRLYALVDSAPLHPALEVAAVTSLSSLIADFIGTYTPLSYVDADGVTVFVTTLAGVDWGYLVRAGVLLICLWSIWACIGLVLRALCGGGR